MTGCIQIDCSWTPPKWKLYGLLLLGANTSSHWIHSWLVLMQWPQSAPCATLESSLTVTCRCARTSPGRSRAASLHCGRYAAFVAALIVSRLDYGCATLAGLPAVQLDRLQTVLNAAVRLVFTARKYDHITPLLRELHWLCAPERITFRLATLVYRCQHGTGRTTWPRTFSEWPTWNRDSDFHRDRRRLRSFQGPCTRQLAIELLALPLRRPGTVYLWLFGTPRHSSHSDDNWRLCCFSGIN